MELMRAQPSCALVPISIGSCCAAYFGHPVHHLGEAGPILQPVIAAARQGLHCCKCAVLLQDLGWMFESQS